MSAYKPSIPTGTRDLGPLESARRTHIFDTIRGVFQLYGYAPIETPAMEKLTTLTGKYGEEGDQLIFKILNQANYFDALRKAGVTEFDERTATPLLAERALRYDLTVPFARYVVMNQHLLTMPFKRYQIQPVWRGDRPSKGRYREFYQCDADVVGSSSLLYEAEFATIYDKALSLLGIRDFAIKINHRQLLNGLVEYAGCPDKFVDVCTAIDKLDKIGKDGVAKELAQRGITEEAAAKVLAVTEITGGFDEVLANMKVMLGHTESGKKAFADLEDITTLLAAMRYPLPQGRLVLDPTLARGLTYYTGAIFEVQATGVSVGSIGGGGRYDNLTAAFGKSGLTGVGISFGADRIYDVMEELGLFATLPPPGARVLLANFGGEAFQASLALLQQLRLAGIPAEAYPTPDKMGKQFGYADKKGIAYTIIIGEEELKNAQCQIKDMASGNQETVTLEQTGAWLAAKLN